LTGVNPAREDCATAIVATGIYGRVGVALLAAAVLGCPPDLPAIGVQAPAPEHADRAVRPQDDLFGHVNGPWLAATVMPPERVSTSAFAEISDRVDLDLRAIIEETAAAPRRCRGW
jgi:hypothetical protein